MRDKIKGEILEIEPEGRFFCHDTGVKSSARLLLPKT